VNGHFFRFKQTRQNRKTWRRVTLNFRFRLDAIIAPSIAEWGKFKIFGCVPCHPYGRRPDDSGLAFALCILGRKQEEKLQPFHHEHVKSLRFRWVQNPNGGALLKALIIVPNVPTDPSDPNFEKTKIDALVDAAIKHLNGQKCTCLLEIEA
jgi:hypothetical protein